MTGMSMQRVLLPPVRVERRCPWEFPSNHDQREEAVTGLAEGIYSRFFRCGYSPDIELGTGNLNAGVPFPRAALHTATCETRGMFRQDSARTHAAIRRRRIRPASILVRGYGEKVRTFPLFGERGAI